MTTGVKRLAGWVSSGVGQVGDRVEQLWGEDDPDGDVLDNEPQVEDEELSRLDDPATEPDAAALKDTGQGDLAELLAKLDPPPELPLTEPFTTGLGSLVRTWIEQQPVGILADPRVARVLDLLGSRLTITVSTDKIVVTGFVISRETSWDRVKQVTLEDRYSFLTDRVITGSVSMLLGRGLLPVPGLAWVVRNLLGLLENLVPDNWRDTMSDESGRALAVIERSWGRDIELEGPLAMVAFMSEGLTAVISDEATRRGLLTTPEES